MSKEFCEHCFQPKRGGVSPEHAAVLRRAKATAEMLAAYNEDLASRTIFELIALVAQAPQLSAEDRILQTRVRGGYGLSRQEQERLACLLDRTFPPSPEDRE